MHDSTSTGPPPTWRSTRQRSAVLSALHDSAELVSARELHANLEMDGVMVGLTTVYRTLRTLERSGRVDVVRDTTGERLYRPRPTDGHRHYLVCRRCGFGRTVEADTVERWADHVATATGFADVEHTVELTGICARCQQDPGQAMSHP